MSTFVINGVPCTLYLGEDGGQGGIRVAYPPDGPHATMTLQCPWAGLGAILNGLRGGVVAGARVPPMQFPYAGNLYCNGVSDPVSVKYTEDAGGNPGFALARFTAEFGVAPFDFWDHDPAMPHMDPSGWAYTTTTLRTSAEFFTPPQGAYYWSTGIDSTQPVYGVNVGILQTKTEYSVKVHWMSTGDIPGIDALEGKVNRYPVRIGRASYPKGTLLFASGNSEVAAESFGARLWNYEYILIGNGPVARTDGSTVIPEWNQFLARDGNYSFLNTAPDGMGVGPYGDADFWGTLPR